MTNMNLQENFFAIFQLPMAYGVDIVALDSRYRELQRSVHPDRHVDASDQDKRLAMQWTTVVNEAHTTLRSPLKRAIYLLKMQQVNIEANPDLDPVFLMSQIELREELESLGSGDEGLASLDVFKARLNEALTQLEADFTSQFEHDLAAAAQTTVYKMQFFVKLADEADRLEEKLLDY
ncbi:MAG: molecular chaperone HscB [Candidatus Azotimanducaceae bacterium]|jgi:molecular chaperone HscB